MLVFMISFGWLLVVCAVFVFDLWLYCVFAVRLVCAWFLVVGCLRCDWLVV